MNRTFMDVCVGLVMGMLVVGALAIACDRWTPVAEARWSPEDLVLSDATVPTLPELTLPASWGVVVAVRPLGTEVSTDTLVYLQAADGTVRVLQTVGSNRVKLRQVWQRSP